MEHLLGWTMSLGLVLGAGCGSLGEDVAPAPSPGVGCTPGSTQSCGECATQICLPESVWGECVEDETCASCGVEGTPCCGDACQTGLECWEGTCTSVPGTGGWGGAGGAEGGSGGASGGAASCTFADADAALVFYYGVMKKADGHTYNDALNATLTVPGLDVVFTVTGKSQLSDGQNTGNGESGEFKQMHDRCARLAYTMGHATLTACLRGIDEVLNKHGEVIGTNKCKPFDTHADPVEATALYLQSKFEAGWDYVDIDEFRNPCTGCTPDVDWSNDKPGSNRFIELLSKLADLGYDRRMIVWFSPGATDIHEQQSPDPFSRFTNVFAACRTHCRKMIFEAYQSTTQIENGGAAHLGHLGLRLHNQLQGTNLVSMAGLSVVSNGNYPSLNDPSCDLAPWGGTSCPALPGSGGLLEQFSAMHDSTYGKYWWGVGFYALGDVVGSTDNAATWTRKDFAESTAKRLEFWNTHSPP